MVSRTRRSARIPAHATVSGEEQGASIVVSDERAAAGKRSLKITDSKTLQPSWQPHFYYEPHITSGVVRQSFDAWLEPDADFFTEWRDTADYPQNVGPSVHFAGSGSVVAGGKTLAKIPSRQWIRVEIEARLGSGRRGSLRFRLQCLGRPRKFSATYRCLAAISTSCTGWVSAARPWPTRCFTWIT